MAKAEAERLAAADGLVLVLADNATGYKGVSRSSINSRSSRSRHFKVAIRQGGIKLSLGTFASVAEAALAYARHLGPERCAAASSASPSRTVKTKSQTVPKTPAAAWEEHSVPQMPVDALVKEEEQEDAPAMPSDALVKTEAVPAMPFDAHVKFEAAASGKKRTREEHTGACTTFSGAGGP